jgi:hypothetical protein
VPRCRRADRGRGCQRLGPRCSGLVCGRRRAAPASDPRDGIRDHQAMLDLRRAGPPGSETSPRRRLFRSSGSHERGPSPRPVAPTRRRWRSARSMCSLVNPDYYLIVGDRLCHLMKPLAGGSGRVQGARSLPEARGGDTPPRRREGQRPARSRRADSGNRDRAPRSLGRG